MAKANGKGATGRSSGRKSGSAGGKNALDQETNERYIAHTIHLGALGSTPLDYNSVEAVKERINLYFALCVSDVMKPNMAGLALSLGTNRTVLRDYVTGQQGTTVVSDQVRQLLELAFNMINALDEAYMMDGIVNPVSGIFMLKNNFGYKDTSETVVRTQKGLPEGKSADALQQKYIEAAQSMIKTVHASDATPPKRAKKSMEE